MSHEKCDHTETEYEQMVEEMFRESIKIHQDPYSPLSNILTALDLTWDDLPPLQAEEVIAIFESAILGILSLTTQDKEDAEQFSIRGILMTEKANTLRALRKNLGEAEE